MGTIQDGGSDLFTAYGLESVSSNLDISNEVLYIIDEIFINVIKSPYVHTCS